MKKVQGLYMIGMLASVFLGLFLVSVFGIILLKSDKSSNIAESVPEIEHLETKLENTSKSPQTSKVINNRTEPNINRFDVLRVCPDSHIITRNSFENSDLSIFTNECWQTLEEYFDAREYVGHRGSTWITIPETMSNERIFKQPQTDRDLVLEALKQEECLFTEVPFLSPELNKACHAESFTAFAAFTDACGVQTNTLHFDGVYEEFRSLYRGSLYVDEESLYPNTPRPSIERIIARNKNTQIIWATNKQGIINQNQFDRVSANDSESLLYSIWMNKKCAEFGLEKLLFSPEDVDRKTYDKLMEIGNALGVSLDEVPDARYTHVIAENLSKVMFAIAAHFGDFTASLSTVVFNLEHPHTTEIQSYLRQEYPWTDIVSFNQSAIQFGGTIEHSNEPLKELINVLKESIQGLVQFDELGYQYDLQWLVDHLCNRICGAFNMNAIRAKQLNDEHSRPQSKPSDQPDSDYINCEQAIDYINEENVLDFRQSVKLDEFEQVARELEILVW
ncbi:MAG: hypothetical protein F4039_03620 [Gammaproteobacteria bacterium]|nr:hypothetical protein [Gammaproteobacteria bacterium]MYK43162.1 hypothetical protein [Gammaproteobacteria bacterium]